jgi:hypothetical protein
VEVMPVPSADRPDLSHQPTGLNAEIVEVEQVQPLGHTGARALGLPLLATAAWGGVVAFVGPTFDFVTGSTTSAWVWNQSHATLHFAPGLVGIFGAVLMLAAATRGRQRLGALLTLTAGAWFVLGPSLEPLWQSSAPGALETSGSRVMRALEAVGYQYGTGALMMMLAAFSLGLLARAAPVPDPAQAAAPARTRRRRVSLRHVSHA